jgi:hypothetical protein
MTAGLTRWRCPVRGPRWRLGAYFGAGGYYHGRGGETGVLAGLLADAGSIR